MKLKTLKDLEGDIYFPPLLPKAKQLLQDTAREWIVSNNKIINELSIWDFDEVVKIKEYESINEWIRYFFNLKE